MILLEYEAKNILQKSGVAVPQAEIVSGAPNLAFPLVIKSQVPTGGRGKAGGIRIVENINEYNQTKNELLKLKIKGFQPKTLLAEKLIDIDKEFYLAFRIDTKNHCIELIAHPSGGIEVEDNESKGFYKKAIVSKSDLTQAAEKLAELYDIPEKTYVLEDLLIKLFECFTSSDAFLLEINPLVYTKDHKLIAADCKMELDDAAGFRHPEWKFEAAPTNTNFVTLDQNGTVATIANGAGLAMATVDAVAAGGLTPANFLDIGGGANEDSVLKAFNEIMRYENVRAIVINIFAGITRCDEVAKAIIAAKKQIPALPPLCIRLAGTNVDEAEKLLDAERIPLLPDLEACTEKAKEYIQ
jgi:succinyl-CoA synthetase beta subunit